jgi:hypothetical protein
VEGSTLQLHALSLLHVYIGAGVGCNVGLGVGLGVGEFVAEAYGAGVGGGVEHAVPTIASPGKHVACHEKYTPFETVPLASVTNLTFMLLDAGIPEMEASPFPYKMFP